MKRGEGEGGGVGPEEEGVEGGRRGERSARVPREIMWNCKMDVAWWGRRNEGEENVGQARGPGKGASYGREVAALGKSARRVQLRLGLSVQFQRASDDGEVRGRMDVAGRSRHLRRCAARRTVLLRLRNWPGAIHEGNGEALVLVDERADAAQRAAIDTLLDGKVGGPWEVLGWTWPKVHGPYPVATILSLTGFARGRNAATTSTWNADRSRTRSQARKCIRASSCPRASS